MSKSAVAINIQIGHTARVLTQSTEEGFTHEWSVCVQGQDNRSITQFVEKVVFILHESFKKPRRTLKNPPFKITERGYGGFNLPVEIYFRSNSEETRKTRFEYDLFLQEISGLPINHIRTERVTFFSPLEEFRKRLLDSGGEIVTCEAGLTSPSSLPSTANNSSSNNTTASTGASGSTGATSGSGGTSRGIRSSTTSSVSADSGTSSAKQNSVASLPHKTSAGKKTKSSGDSSAGSSSATAVKKEMKKPDSFITLFGEPLQPYKEKAASAPKAKAGSAVKSSKAPLDGSKSKEVSSSSKDKADKSSSKARDKDSSTKERKHEDKKDKKDKERDKSKSSKSDKKSGDKEKSDKSSKHKDPAKKEEGSSSKDKKSSKSDKEKKDSKDKHRERDKSASKENVEKLDKHDKPGHSKAKDSSSKKTEAISVPVKKESSAKSESKSTHEKSFSKSHKDKNDDKSSKSKESSQKSSSSKVKSERASPKPDQSSTKKESHSKHKSESSKSSSYSKEPKSSGSVRSPVTSDRNAVTPPIIVTTSPAPSGRQHGGVSSSASVRGAPVSPNKEDSNPRSSKKRCISPIKKASALSERIPPSSPSFKPSPSHLTGKSSVGAHSLSPSPSSCSSVSKHSLPPPPLPSTPSLKVSPSQLTSPKSAVLKVNSESPRKKIDSSPQTISPCNVNQSSKRKKKRPRETPVNEHVRPEPVTPASVPTVAAPAAVRQNDQGVTVRRSRSRSSSSSNYSRSSSRSGSDSPSVSSRSRSKSRSRSPSSSSARSRSSRSASPSSGNPSGSRSASASASASASPSRSRSHSRSAGEKSRSPSASSSSSISSTPPPRANNPGDSSAEKCSTLKFLLAEVSSTSDSELEMPQIKRQKVEKPDVSKESKKNSKGSSVQDISANPSAKTAVSSKKEAERKNAPKDASLNRTAPVVNSKDKFGSRSLGVVSDGKYSNDDDDNSEEIDDASEDEKISESREVRPSSVGATFSDTDISDDEIGVALSDSEEERIFEEGKSYVQSKTKENGELELSEYPDWYFNESRVFYLRRSLPRLQRLQLDVTIGSLRARQFGEAGLEALRRAYGCLVDNNVPLTTTELGSLKIEWRSVRPRVLKKILNIFKEYTKVEE